MNSKINSKLLDVVRLRNRDAEHGADEAAGTIIELLESVPQSAVIEIADDDGVPIELIVAQLQDLETVPRISDAKEQPDPTAQDLFEQGLLLLNNGLVPSAKIAFVEAFRLDPQYAGTLNNLARDAAQQGAYDLAIFLFQMILELRPSYRLALENLASTHLNKGVALGRQSMIEMAINEFNSAILLRPSDTILRLSQLNLLASYTGLGVRNAEAKRYKEAIPFFSIALEIDPSNEVARRNFALALVSVSAVERENQEIPAEEGFNHFTLIGLTVSECWNAYGATLAGLGQLSKARAAVRKAVQVDPANALAKRNLEILESREESPDLSLGITQFEPQSAPTAVWH